MKILVEDKISNIEALNMSTYQGSNSQHDTSVMLNDYPTAQWVSTMPNSYSEVLDSYGNPTGRLKIEALLEAYGVTSMNGIYLGNFNGDGINYNVYQDIRSAGASNPIWSSIGTADAPIRVFPSFGHFVRGRPNAYTDYLYTLTELGFSQEYVYTNFKINITIRSEINLMIDPNVFFRATSVTDVKYSDEGSTRKYWLLRGQLMDSGANPLRFDSELFSSNLQVGMIALTSLPAADNDIKLTDGTAAVRMVQIVEMKGNGSKSEGVGLLIRSFENSGVEDPFENILTASGVTFVDAEGQTTETAAFPTPKDFSLSYLFASMRIGLFRAGYIEHFPNPQVGLSRTYRDFSIRKSLVNGGHQYANRNIAKIYSGRLILDRDRVRRFLSFSEFQRAKPFPVEVLSSFEEETPTVFYGFFANSPSENMSQRTGVIRDIDFSIQQVF